MSKLTFVPDLRYWDNTILNSRIFRIEEMEEDIVICLAGILLLLNKRIKKEDKLIATTYPTKGSVRIRVDRNSTDIYGVQSKNYSRTVPTNGGQDALINKHLKGKNEFYLKLEEGEN